PAARGVAGRVDAWAGFVMRAALEERLQSPALVLNDGEVRGAGVIAGAGLELMLTFGTGLGNAVFDGGALAPHQELSRGPVRWGLTYDEYVGEHERLRLGDAMWSRRIRRVVEALRPMYLWDRLYIGGGNSCRLYTSAVDKLVGEVVFVLNCSGIIGGVLVCSLRV